MNKKQENRLTMYEGLLVLLQTNSAMVKGIGGMVDTVAEFAGLVSAIKSKSVQVDIASVGKVAAKYSAQASLIKALMPLCAILYVLGRRIGNLEIQGRVALTETKLRGMRDTELATVATGLIELAIEYAAALEPLSFGAEKLSDVKSKAEVYAASIGAQEVGVAERKGARSTMNDLFEKADELLHEELDHFVELLRPKDSELYTKYFSARMVKDLGVRHRPVPEAADPVPVTSAPAKV